MSKFDWPFTPIHKSSRIYFNSHGFGPPAGVTQPSTCSWIDHLVSGRHATNLVALFRLAFAAPTPNGLSLLDT